MPAYIESTGRSFPNPIKSEDYAKPFERPASGNYRSRSGYQQGTGTQYYIEFEGMGLAVCHWVRTRYTISVKRMSSA